MLCAICRTFPRRAFILPCGHYFCQRCLKEWFFQVENRKFTSAGLLTRPCPYCRQPFSRPDINIKSLDDSPAPCSSNASTATATSELPPVAMRFHELIYCEKRMIDCPRATATRDASSRTSLHTSPTARVGLSTATAAVFSTGRAIRTTTASRPCGLSLDLYRVKRGDREQIDLHAPTAGPPQCDSVQPGPARRTQRLQYEHRKVEQPPLFTRLPPRYYIIYIHYIHYYILYKI